MATRSTGKLFVIGGGEDKKGDRLILRRFVDVAGGEASRVVVVGTATTMPEEVGDEYVRVFRELGVSAVEFLPLQSRDESNDPAAASMIDKATGIFVTGGDQLRIATILGGSAVDVAMHSAYENGLVIAGTSAGAAMMSSTMILGGYDLLPTTGAVRLGPGLEFVTGLVIDMHFAERGRLSRLLAAVAMFPHELGLGIDEDTAVVVEGNEFEVIGSGAATVVDAGSVTSLHTPPDGEPGPIAMTGVQLHVLPSGYSFDLSTRSPVITAKPHDGDSDER